MDILDKIKKLESDASQFGFKWQFPSQIIEQIKSECIEINEHLTSSDNATARDQLQEEIGDLLHAAFSLCIFCQFDPGDTLKYTTAKFERRLNAVKQLAAEAGFSTLEKHSFEEL